MTSGDLADTTIGGFLDSLAARAPAPGGGATAALHAAQALCEAGQDFGRAAEYAKRAARVAPDMIAAHICLTRVYFKAGRTASARSALEQATKLDPRHADVVALGQKLRG